MSEAPDTLESPSPVVRFGRGFARAVDRTVAVVNIAATGATFLMVIVLVLDISGRAMFNKPFPGSYEITEMLMVAVVFLSFAYCESRNAHIRVDLLSQYLPRRFQYALDLIAYLAGIFIYSLIAYAALQLFKSSWAIKEFTPGAVPLPVYPAKMIMLIGSILLIVMFLVRAVQSAIGVAARIGGCK